LIFIDDLYVLFSRKILDHNLFSSCNSISDYEDYINHFIYIFLFDGTLSLNEWNLDRKEYRQLNEPLFKGSSRSSVSKFVGITEYFTNTILIINSFLELLFDIYCKIPNLIKSVDVVFIRHNNTGLSPILTSDDSRRV